MRKDDDLAAFLFAEGVAKADKTDHRDAVGRLTAEESNDKHIFYNAMWASRESLGASFKAATE